MISDIHPPDEHALFPHKIITCKTEKVTARTKQGKILEKETFVAVYLVCATCGHWSNRIAVPCNCRSSCHDEMAERLAFEATNLIGSKGTNQTEAKEANNVHPDQHPCQDRRQDRKR